MNKIWTVTLEEDYEGNAILPFPEDMLKEAGWQENDILDFRVNDDESCTIINLSWQERQSAGVSV